MYAVRLALARIRTHSDNAIRCIHSIQLLSLCRLSETESYFLSRVLVGVVLHVVGG